MYHIIDGYATHNSPYEKVGDREPVCIADEMPFGIPDSWGWARIGSIGTIIRGSGIERNETVKQGLPCVRYGEIYTTYNISFAAAKSFITADLYKKCKHFSHGDVLMILTGENKPDIAKAVAYLGDSEIAAGGDLAFWTAHGMNPLFLTYLLKSPYVIGKKVELTRPYCEKNSTSCARPTDSTMRYRRTSLRPVGTYPN